MDCGRFQPTCNTFYPLQWKCHPTLHTAGSNQVSHVKILNRKHFQFPHSAEASWLSHSCFLDGGGQAEGSKEEHLLYKDYNQCFVLGVHFSQKSGAFWCSLFVKKRWNLVPALFPACWNSVFFEVTTDLFYTCQYFSIHAIKLSIYRAFVRFTQEQNLHNHSRISSYAK